MAGDLAITCFHGDVIPCSPRGGRLSRRAVSESRSDQPGGTPATASLAQLLLDPANPRLATSLEQGEQPSQDELVRVLWQEMAVDEVALSIAANGYYPEERLLVVPAAKAPAGQSPLYVVVEGNRRLAAVRLLVDAELRRKVEATDLPEIDKSDRAKLLALPVQVYGSRKELWPYLGFRHINGVRQWDSYSKARYVSEVHDTYSVPLSEIAKRIGDRHSTVTRLYRGMKVLEQAQREARFDVDDRFSARFSFSHLYTALDQPEYQRFLGITAEGSLRPDPVPKKKISQLSELAIWLYGKRSSRIRPVIVSQNPDLNVLRDVIGNNAALSALRSGLPLAAAREIALGDERRFADSLTRAAEELRRAKGTVTTGYSGDAAQLRTIDDAVLLAQSIQREMHEIAAAPRRRAG
jgi:hypothetical protein